MISKILVPTDGSKTAQKAGIYVLVSHGTGDEVANVKKIIEDSEDKSC
jgi:hypothetical protein